MEIKLTDEQINTLVHHLQGTCSSFSEGLSCLELPDNDDLMLTETDFDSETLGKIDEEIFCCDVCNWWCEAGETHSLNDEDVCSQCFQEAGGEEDEDD